MPLHGDGAFGAAEQTAVGSDDGPVVTADRYGNARAVGHDDGPCDEGMRTDGRDNDAADLWHDDGTAGREGIPGRAGRCRKDSAVAPPGDERIFIDADRYLDGARRVAFAERDVVESNEAAAVKRHVEQAARRGPQQAQLHV